KGHDIQRRMRDQQKEDHASDARRDGEQNDERINERRELGHQDQVNQHDGEHQSGAKTQERLVHRYYGTAYFYSRIGRKLRVLDELVHFAGKRPQILAFRRNIHVDHAEELVVVHLGGSVDHLDVGHVFQHGGIAVIGCMQWDLFEVFQGHRTDLLIGVLHGKEIVISVLGIDPVTGSNHAVGGKSGYHVVHHIAGCEPEACRHFTAHVELKAGIVKILRNQHIADVIHRSQLPGHLARHLVSGLLVISAHLDVDRRRHALIDN